MKPFYLGLSLLIGTCASLKAQMRLDFSIGPSASLNVFQRGRLNDFVNSYNAYYQANNNFTQPFKPISSSQLGWGWHSSLKFVSDNLGVGGYFHQDVFQQKRESYLGQWGRALELEFRDWSAGVSFGRVWDRASLDLILGAGIRRSNVRSLQIYPDGSRSIGEEFFLNGYYRMQRASLNIGLAYEYEFKPWLGLKLRAEYFSPGFMSGRADQLALYALSDNYKDPVSAAYLPHDFGLWVDNVNNNTYDYEENVIPAQFFGLTTSLSLVFKLNLLAPKSKS